MKNIGNEFKKFSMKDRGISSLALDRYSDMTRSVIEERSVNFREVDVFSRLIMDRIIFIGSEINDEVANVAIAQLLFLDSCDENRDISLYINSPGGSIYAGLGIYDTMQYVESEIQTICVGLAASMAAVLLSGGTNEKRFALRHSRIMIHQPLGGVKGQATEIEITMKHILTLKKDLYDILAKHTGKTYEDIERDSDRDCWMNAEEAKSYGLVDNILTKKPNR